MPLETAEKTLLCADKTIDNIRDSVWIEYTPLATELCRIDWWIYVRRWTHNCHRTIRVYYKI